MSLGILYDIDQLTSRADYEGNYAIMAWRIFFSGVCRLEGGLKKYMPNELRGCDIAHGDIGPRTFCIALRESDKCADEFLRSHMSLLSLPGLMQQSERFVTSDEIDMQLLSVAASIIGMRFFLVDGNLLWLFLEAAKRELACGILTSTRVMRNFADVVLNPGIPEDDLRVIVNALEAEELLSITAAFSPLAAQFKDDADFSKFSILFRKLVLARHEVLTRSSDRETKETFKQLLLANMGN